MLNFRILQSTEIGINYVYCSYGCWYGRGTSKQFFVANSILWNIKKNVGHLIRYPMQ